MSVDLDLGYATRLAEDYESLILPSVTGEGILEASYRAAKLVSDNFPFYDSEATSPIPGLNGETGSLNCAGRTALIHAVLTENPRLYPAIAKVDIEEYDDVHFLNGVVDVDTGKVFVIDTSLDSRQGIETGKIEVLADPWATRESNPSFYGPIFESVMRGTSFLSQNPDVPKVNLVLKYLELSHIRDDKGRAFRLHLHPENLPSQELMDERGVRILADTIVTVYDCDKSDRIVDEISYGKSE